MHSCLKRKSLGNSVPSRLRSGINSMSVRPTGRHFRFVGFKPHNGRARHRITHYKILGLTEQFTLTQSPVACCRFACWLMVVLAPLLLGMNLPAAVQAEMPQVRLVASQPFAQRNGTPLLADLYLPPGDGPFPGVLMVHGGAWAGGSRSHMAAHAMYLARRGYAVATISYRFAPTHQFPAQIEDCRAGLEWLISKAPDFGIDPQRIGAWGYSAGGHLVCLLAAARSAEEKKPALQAVVAGGAPCDFTTEPQHSERLKFFLGGSRSEVPETYVEASPISHVTRNCPPMFLFHGTSDEIVPMESSRVMYERLSDLGVPVTYYKVSGRGHLGAFIDQEARREALKFLDDHLKLGRS